MEKKSFFYKTNFFIICKIFSELNDEFPMYRIINRCPDTVLIKQRGTTDVYKVASGEEVKTKSYFQFLFLSNVYIHMFRKKNIIDVFCVARASTRAASCAAATRQNAACCQRRSASIGVRMCVDDDVHTSWSAANCVAHVG